MQITPLKQTNPNNCGQTVIAMLFDIDIAMAERLVGHNGITTEEEILKILKNHRLLYEQSKSETITTTGATWLQLHKNPKNSKQKHWTLLVNGVIIDPSGRKESDLWPVEKFWILNI